jgi:NADH-quinone oxidoreductase subunit L
VSARELLDTVWIIPALPLLGATILLFFGRRIGEPKAGWLATGLLGLAFAWSVVMLIATLSLPDDARANTVNLFTWIPAGALEVNFGFLSDQLSVTWILLVTGVGSLIHLYAIGYMHGDPRFSRFFGYLNLFAASMLILVLGSSFLVTFLGWEGVGLCSYLLISHWFERERASVAGKKAFVTNRVGDFGFMLAMFFIVGAIGSLDYTAMDAQAGGLASTTATAIALLLFVGCVGKSAQIPLHVWLPDAMEGPTPVSALIHAATMVTAGVYMVARNAVLFSQAPRVMLIVAIVGALTALMAATIGLVQNDIKRVLAYSTVSQLGYMFLALGVGAFAAGVFHLMTHAFFKALLFLGSGSVIHASSGEQDLQKLGGLRRFMPVTFGAMMIGTLAIAGIPPFSGFFSKDEILYQTFVGNPALWGLAVLTALLTAFYMFRLMALTFWGTYRGPAAHGSHGPHESPRLMTWPLIALAAGAVLAGAAGIPKALGGSNAIEHFLAPSFSASHGRAASTETGGASAAPADAQPGADASGHGMELGLMLLSVLVAAAGILMARRMYVDRPEIPERMAARWSGLHSLLSNKYYVDEIYDATVGNATTASSEVCATFDRRVIDGAVDGSGWLTKIAAWISYMFDKYVVDGLVNLVGWVSGESSYGLRRFQTGLVQNYALVMVLGVFVFLTVYLLSRSI